MSNKMSISSNKYGHIPGLDRQVSRIFFGCAIRPMNLGQDAGELLDAALENGINAFDTARVYGNSEVSFGNWLRSRRCRDRVVLLTKGGHPAFSRDKDGNFQITRRISRKEIREDLEQSLLALGVDNVDIYLLHRDDPSVPAEEIAVWMDELVKEGKARTIGGSNWTHQRIEAAREYALAHGLTPFTVSSPHFSLAETQTDLYGDNCVTLTGDANAEVRAWYRENPVAVISFASLSQGFFSGRWTSDDFRNNDSHLKPEFIQAFGSEKNLLRLDRTRELAAEKGCTVSQLALRWGFSQGMNLFAAVGSTSPQRMLENWQALDLPLSKEEADWLTGK